MRYAGWHHADPYPDPGLLWRPRRNGSSPTGSPSKPYRPLEAQSPLDAPLLRPLSGRISGRLRTSNRCLHALQAPLQKIDPHCLLTDLRFQLRHTALGPATLTVTRKRVARRLPELTHSTVQHVGVDFQFTRHFDYRDSRFQPAHRTAFVKNGVSPLLYLKNPKNMGL